MLYLLIFFIFSVVQAGKSCETYCVHTSEGTEKTFCIKPWRIEQVLAGGGYQGMCDTDLAKCAMGAVPAEQCTTMCDSKRVERLNATLRECGVIPSTIESIQADLCPGQDLTPDDVFVVDTDPATGALCLKSIHISGQDGLACWDLNGDGHQDPSEDINGDGYWNTLDCKGAKGDKGDKGDSGNDGAPGQDGLSCWDLNGDGNTDAAEDINGDGVWDTLDCKGEKGDQGDVGTPGADGQDGADGADGLGIDTAPLCDPGLVLTSSTVLGFNKTGNCLTEVVVGSGSGIPLCAGESTTSVSLLAYDPAAHCFRVAEVTDGCTKTLYSFPPTYLIPPATL